MRPIKGRVAPEAPLPARGPSPDASGTQLRRGLLPAPSTWLTSAAAERLAIAVITALAVGVRLAYGEHIRDDAYITLRYAEHLAGGLGFTYNTGQHVLGTTTPLYTLLLAVLARIGVPVDRAAFGVGITADALAIPVLWRFGRLTIGRRATIFSCLLYALMAPLVAYAVSGMETPLYLLLILVTFLLAVRHKWSWTAVGCALLVLLRPDGVLVPFALAASEVWSRARPRASHRPGIGIAREVCRLVRASGRPIGIFLMLTMPWFGFAWWYFGSPVPQSVLAKWQLPNTPPFASFWYFPTYFLDLRLRGLLPITALAALGAADLRRRSALHPLVLWAAVYAAAFLLSNKFVYPLWPFQWYFLPLLIPLAVSAGCGATRLSRSPRLPAAGVPLGVALAIFEAVYLVRQYPVLVQNVAGREALYLQMANILTGYGAAHTTVAAAEIGALGAAHPGPVVDLAGLVSPEAAGRSTLDILQATQPPWLVLWNTYDAHQLGASTWFGEHYRPVRQLENWESRRLVLFRWYPTPQVERTHGLLLAETFALLGRRLWWQELPTERILHVELTWEALARPQQPMSFSLQLNGADGSKLAQQDNTPQEGSRPATTWVPMTPILDRYDLALALPNSRDPAALVIQGYQRGNPANALGWRSPAGSPIGPRLYVPLPPIASPAGPPLSSCDVAFSGGLALAGYRIESSGDSARLQLRWLDRRPLDQDYTVFVHALDNQGRLVAQADGPPFGGAIDTSTLFPGDQLDDVHTLHAPVSSIATVAIGLYRPETGVRVRRSDRPGDQVILRVAPPMGCQ